MDYKVDHIGIAVNDLKTSIPLYERLLGEPCYKTEQVPSEAVDTAFDDIHLISPFVVSLRYNSIIALITQYSSTK